jgi:hypothetical protein
MMMMVVVEVLAALGCWRGGGCGIRSYYDCMVGYGLRTDLPATHQTDICMTCRLWVLFDCLNGVAASPQNYTHPKVVAVRDVVGQR